MALDPRYVLASDLELYLVDKDTGLPLRHGVITFYSDADRSIKKPVFQLSGSFPNYTYSQLPNPCILSDEGTFQDALGNNIVPYYKPYDASNNIDLYYVDVKSENGIPQFTRAAWPNVIQDTASQELEFTNFVPNGQFITHTDLPNNLVTATGDTALAQGGWYFNTPVGFSNVYKVFFNRLGPDVATLINDYPRYAINVQCITNNGDSSRRLRLKFPNVNQFSYFSDIQLYRLFLHIESLDLNTYTIPVHVYKFFGTGSSTPDSDVSVGVVTSNNTFTANTVLNIDFGKNNTDTIGDTDDDFVAIDFILPTGTFNIQLTDVVLAFNDINVTTFPETTNAEMLSLSLAPVPPLANGYNLYLPTILTRDGIIYDVSTIGKVEGKFTATEINNELICDGRQFAVADYSALGIPYGRLFTALFSISKNISRFGGGTNFVNNYLEDGNNANLFLCRNNFGLEADPVDGSTPTGFTFPGAGSTSINPGRSADIIGKAYNNINAYVVCKNTVAGVPQVDAAPGTSGMMVIQFPPGTSSRAAFSVVALSAALLAAGGTNQGLYFTYASPTQKYLIWFKVGTEVVPSSGPLASYIKIECNLNPSMTAADVAIAIANVFNGNQTNLVTVTGVPPNGSFFKFYSNTLTYSPYYQVDNAVVTVPASPNPIKVSITSGDTAAQIAFKTQTQINSQFFAIPDLRGMFLRGADPSSIWDNATQRTSTVGTFGPNQAGTLELDFLGIHDHDQTVNIRSALAQAPPVNSVLGSDIINLTSTTTMIIHETGGYETRPVNTSVHWFIRY